MPVTDPTRRAIDMTGVSRSPRADQQMLAQATYAPQPETAGVAPPVTTTRPQKARYTRATSQRARAAPQQWYSDSPLTPLSVPTNIPAQAPSTPAPVVSDRPSIAAPTGQFGFRQGAIPGGDVIQFLMRLGFPIPQALRALHNVPGAPASPYANVARPLQRYGNLSLPSAQGLRRTSPSGLEFLRGALESTAGIPFQDILFAALSPTRGLQRAPMARRRF